MAATCEARAVRRHCPWIGRVERWSPCLGYAPENRRQKKLSPLSPCPQQVGQYPFLDEHGMAASPATARPDLFLAPRGYVPRISRSDKQLACRPAKPPS